MRFISTILLLTLCFSGAFAQKMSFEFQAGLVHDFIPDYKNQYLKSLETLSIINDSLAVRAIINQEWTARESYRSNKIGGQFGTRTVFHLDNKTDLLTGFSLTVRTLTPTFDLRVNYISLIKSTDTITLQLGSGSTFKPCVYDNALEDIEYDPTNQFRSWHLSIPLEVRHHFTPKLSVLLGAFVATPIRSRVHYETFDIESRYVNGVQHCTYVKVEVNDRSGQQFRDLTYGFSGGVQWNLTRHLYAGLNAQKYMGTLLQPKESLSSFYEKDKSYQALPISLSLQVGYRL